VGEITGGTEICNCLDDDCDGLTDEDTTGGLCPGDTVCLECECVTLCMPGIEFRGCEQGKMEIEDANGRCLCVHDPCDATACAATTIEDNGNVVCAPKSDNVAPCRCLKGDCVSACEGVTCASSEVCNPKDGRCVVNRCESLGCEPGNRCDALTGQCVPDLCANATCAANEVCRDGACEPSCAGKQCAEGSVCKSGKCVTDRCASVVCNSAQFCNPDSGACEDNACAQKSCSDGLTCDPISGECLADPCAVVICPTDQECKKGECYAKSDTQHDVGAAPTTEKSRFVSSAGGGGCSCAVTGFGPYAGGGLLWLAGLGLLWMRFRRRALRNG
jgi:MYXO-CTERM domain-containing protein